jgi:peptidyl-tRNA hydrolase
MMGKNYMRLRLGVDRPLNKDFATSDYVLGKFSKIEMQQVDRINEKVSDLIEELFEAGADKFLNKFYL